MSPPRPARARARRLALIVLVALAGCAGGRPPADLEGLDRLLARAGASQGPGDADEADPVPALLARELTVDAAVRIALLRNRGLSARLAEVGVAGAELITALTPENPQLEGVVRLAGGSGAGPSYELTVTQDLVSLILMPLRARAAEARIERARLEVADEVVRLSRDVEAAWYELQGATVTREVLATFSQAARASYEYAHSLRVAGNLSQLDLANQEVLLEQARLELARAEAEVLQLRERLARLMGLWGSEAEALSLPARLPELPPAEAPLDRLEGTAVERRLDLAALRQELEALRRERDTASTARWLPGLAAGVSGERDGDGEWAIGPAVSLSLPVFDRRQGELARLEAHTAGARDRLTDLAVAIRAEVRAARARLLATREIAVHLRDRLVPLRERIVRLAQEQHDFMLVGTFQLLAAKQEQLHTYRAYADSVRDYWLAHNELRRAVGGPLPAAQE